MFCMTEESCTSDCHVFKLTAMVLRCFRDQSHMITAHSNTLLLNVIMRPNYNSGVGAVDCTLLNPSTSVAQPIFTLQKRASV